MSRPQRRQPFVSRNGCAAHPCESCSAARVSEGVKSRAGIAKVGAAGMELAKGGHSSYLGTGAFSMRG